MSKSLAFVALGAFSAGLLLGLVYHNESEPARKFASSVSVEAPLEGASDPVACLCEASKEVQLGMGSVEGAEEGEKQVGLEAADVAEVSRSALEQQETIQRALESHRQVESFQHFVARAKRSNVSPLDMANEHFSAEAIDYEWAMNKEQEIIDAFKRQPELMGTSPLSIACKTSRCRVVVAVESAVQADKLSGQFSNALTSESHRHGLSSVSYFSDTQSGELVLYLSENAIASTFGK